MGGRTSKSSLSVEDLVFLTRKTGYDEQAVREWHKLFKRSASGGCISQTHFLQLYSKFFTGGDARQFTLHVFRTFGSRKGGEQEGELKLDFREYLTAVHESASGSEEARLRRAFRMLDRNQDGMVTEGDVRSVFLAAGEMLEQGLEEGPREAAGRLWATLDVEGEGSVTEVQFLKVLWKGRIVTEC